MDEVPLEITMPEYETDFPVRPLNWRSMGDSGRLYTRSEMQVLRDRITTLEDDLRHARLWANYILFDPGVEAELHAPSAGRSWITPKTAPAIMYCRDRDGKLQHRTASDGWQVGEEMG